MSKPSIFVKQVYLSLLFFAAAALALSAAPAPASDTDWLVGYRVGNSTSGAAGTITGSIDGVDDNDVVGIPPAGQIPQAYAVVDNAGTPFQQDARAPVVAPNSKVYKLQF